MIKTNILLTTGCLVWIFIMTGGVVQATDPRIAVSGIGYPPVKAQNKAQALLMAKRAAILDAYRRALTGQNEYNGSYDQEGYYRGLSGFIKGLIITKEEYLNDGGVKIEATVSPKDVVVYKKEKSGKIKSSGTGPAKKEGPASKEGPTRVTRDEWYKIIENMVIFESRDLKKGGE